MLFLIFSVYFVLYMSDCLNISGLAGELDGMLSQSRLSKTFVGECQNSEDLAHCDAHCFFFWLKGYCIKQN